MKGSQVTIDHVSKRFGDFVALDDINFTIEPGEFFSLLVLLDAEKLHFSA